MAESSGNDNSTLYFIVGGLLVLVLGMFLYFGGYVGTYKSKTTTIEQTTTPSGAESSTTTTTTKEGPQ